MISAHSSLTTCRNRPGGMAPTPARSLGERAPGFASGLAPGLVRSLALSGGEHVSIKKLRGLRVVCVRAAGAYVRTQALSLARSSFSFSFLFVSADADQGTVASSNITPILNGAPSKKRTTTLNSPSQAQIRTGRQMLTSLAATR